METDRQTDKKQNEQLVCKMSSSRTT